jgi:hypothetical protein
MPIRTAPIATRMVPTRESKCNQHLPPEIHNGDSLGSHIVNGSPSIIVAHIVLNTRPDYIG